MYRAYKEFQLERGKLSMQYKSRPFKDCHTRDFAKFSSKQILMVSKWCLVSSFMVILQCLHDQILI